MDFVKCVIPYKPPTSPYSGVRNVVIYWTVLLKDPAIFVGENTLARQVLFRHFAITETIAVHILKEIKPFISMI